MTDLTESESYDSGVYQLSVADEVKGFDPANPGDGIGKSNFSAQNLANRTKYLHARVGIQGNWDMTGVPAPCAPDPGIKAGVTTAGTAPHAITLAPNSPLFNAGGSGHMTFQFCTPNVMDGNEQWLSLVVPVPTGGDTVLEYGFIFTNSGATLADIESTASTGNAVGTCQFIMFILPIPTSNLIGIEILKPAGSPTVNFATALAAVAGDTIHMGFNTSNGDLRFQVNAGSPYAGAIPFDMSLLTGGESLRPGGALVSSADPAVFGAGSITYDFSDVSALAGTSEGFGGSGDATPPVDYDDAKSYLVSVAGKWNGYTTQLNDVVTFRSGKTALIIDRAPPDMSLYATSAALTVETAARIAADATKASADELLTAACPYVNRDIQDDAPAIPAANDLCVVGAGHTGAFAGIAAGSLLEYRLLPSPDWYLLPQKFGQRVQFNVQDNRIGSGAYRNVCFVRAPSSLDLTKCITDSGNITNLVQYLQAGWYPEDMGVFDQHVGAIGVPLDKQVAAGGQIILDPRLGYQDSTNIDPTLTAGHVDVLIDRTAGLPVGAPPGDFFTPGRSGLVKFSCYGTGTIDVNLKGEKTGAPVGTGQTLTLANTTSAVCRWTISQVSPDGMGVVWEVLYIYDTGTNDVLVDINGLTTLQAASGRGWLRLTTTGTDPHPALTLTLPVYAGSKPLEASDAVVYPVTFLNAVTALTVNTAGMGSVANGAAIPAGVAAGDTLMFMFNGGTYTYIGKLS